MLVKDLQQRCPKFFSKEGQGKVLADEEPICNTVLKCPNTNRSMIKYPLITALLRRTSWFVFLSNYRQSVQCTSESKSILFTNLSTISQAESNLSEGRIWLLVSLWAPLIEQNTWKHFWQLWKCSSYQYCIWILLFFKCVPLIIIFLTRTFGFSPTSGVMFVYVHGRFSCTPVLL